MDKVVKSQILIATVAAGIAVALILSAVYLGNFFEEQEELYEEQEQTEYKEADPTTTIPKADSDYYNRADYDLNGDGAIDVSEIKYDEGTDIPTPDGLSDIEEIYQYGTDVSNPDTDGDGMEDGWEAFFSRDPLTNKWRVNPRTGRLAIDPNFRDGNEDPDNDGFDVNNDGRYTTDENLTNLKEYCGGKIFEDHNPFDGVNDDADMRFIRSHGGFHLAWKIEYAETGKMTNDIAKCIYPDPDPEFQSDEFAYLYDNKFYNDYNPYKEVLVTTDPTDRDSDDDRMYDGWELYYQNVTTFYADVYLIEFTENQTLDPMDPKDAKYDMDVKKTDDTLKGLTAEEEFEIYPDGLTNIQEFENNTNPVLWDTDDDTFYDPGGNFGLGEIYEMDDWTELTQLEASCVSNTDWDRDGEYDLVTNPNDVDTDGDYMGDGFEIYYGLCPLNSSDRFLDLDGDGLLNYLEYRYPEVGNQWFQTDPNDKDTDDDGIPDGWEAKNAQVIEEKWWTFDADDNEILICYEYGRQHHIETENVKYMRSNIQFLDASDGILDRHWYNFSVNPMVADNDLDYDGYWYDDPDEYRDEVSGINTELDGDNDTIPDFHWQPDNLTNMYEWNGTEMFSGDYFDGLTNPNNPDTDGDGLLDGDELLIPIYGELIGNKWFTTDAADRYYYTNPNLADSDQDFDPSNSSRSLDDWEEINGITHDGYNFGELYDTFTGTNATSPDTDLDGMNDVDEIFGLETGAYDPDDITSGFGMVKTNPGNKDSDSDGAYDADEITRIKSYHPYITDPNNPDTDNDLLKDGDELKVDYFPYVDYFTYDNFDANDDGDYTDTDIGDFINTVDRTNPRLFDSDYDGLPDGWEAMNGGTTDLVLIGLWINAHPTDSYAMVLLQFLDTNGDGQVGVEDNIPEVRVFLVNPLNKNDKYEDPDYDGLNNYEEFKNNTDPLSWDTDGDQLPDGWEIKFSKKNLDPTRADTNGDDEPDDEDHDGNYDVIEEIINSKDDDGDGRIDEEYDKNDANEDYDKDGMIYYMWNLTDGEWKYAQYYHPFSNYYEYYWGWSNDDDPYHEVTTDPNERDSDGDSMPDGWEIWVSDYPMDDGNKTIYEDKDYLAKGWEDLFNGTMGLFPLDYVPKLMSMNVNDQDKYRGKMDSTRHDTNKNGTGDWADDYDGDGANNLIEYRYHTDPTDSDSSPQKIGIPMHDITRSTDTRGAEEPTEIVLSMEVPVLDDYFIEDDLQESEITSQVQKINNDPAVSVSKQKQLCGKEEF